MRTTIIFFSCLALSLIIALSQIYFKRSLPRPVLGTDDKQEATNIYTSSQFHFRFPYPSLYHIKEENDGRTITLNESFSSSPSATIQIVLTDTLSPTRSLFKEVQALCSNGEIGSCSQIESQSVVTNIHGTTGIMYYFKQVPDKRAGYKRGSSQNKGPFYLFHLKNGQKDKGLLLFTINPRENELLSFIVDNLEFQQSSSISSESSPSPTQERQYSTSSAQQRK